MIKPCLKMHQQVKQSHVLLHKKCKAIHLNMDDLMDQQVYDWGQKVQLGEIWEFY